MEKDKLVNYLKDGFTIKKIAKTEEKSQTTVRYWLKKHSLTPNNWFSFNENELRKAALESNSINQLLLKLNKNTSSNGYKLIKRAIIKYNIDISHFLTQSEKMKIIYREKGVSNDNLFTSNSVYSRTTIKKRILRDKLIDYKCVFCGQDDDWRGKKISLILDHINGINNDNRIENLRFLCPNCNATLDTHCKGVVGLNQKLLKEKIKRDIPKKKYSIRINQRKVKNRPSYEQLLNEIEELGYVGTGKKYGVSDNAIRKWVKK